LRWVAVTIGARLVDPASAAGFPIFDSVKVELPES
jgi:hypothetical protein